VKPRALSTPAAIKPARSIRGPLQRDDTMAIIDMCRACDHLFSMSVMIQIRNVPETLHRQLKSRAALAGMSLSDYLLGEIRQVAARPTLEELRARLAHRAPVSLARSPAEAVRDERDRP
jgi:plasmid stability protein